MFVFLDKKIVCFGKVCMLICYDVFVNVGRMGLKKMYCYSLK